MPLHKPILLDLKPGERERSLTRIYAIKGLTTKFGEEEEERDLEPRSLKDNGDIKETLTVVKRLD